MITAEAPSRLKRQMRSRGPLVLLILLFMALRLSTLLTSVEKVSYVEELYRGTIAKEILSGLKLPLGDYQADVYAGGSVVTGILAAPFFSIFGASLFALKLVPLVFSLLAFALSFFFLKKFFGEETAYVGALLLIFCPPDLTALSLMALGSHPESILFLMGVWFGLYGILTTRGKSLFFCLLFGSAMGMGFSFTFSTVVAALSGLIAWFLIDRRSFLSRAQLPVVAGFLIALSPTLIFNLSHKLKGFIFLAQGFSGAPASNLFFIYSHRLARALFKLLPVSFSFADAGPLPGNFFSYSYYVLSLGAYGFLIKEAIRFKERLLVPLLLYPGVFLIVYTLSHFQSGIGPYISYRYFFSLHYLGVLLIAIAAARIRNRQIKAIFVGLFLILGVCGQASLLRNESFGRALSYQGYSYTALGDVLNSEVYRYPEKIKEFNAFASSYAPDSQRYLYFGYLVYEGYLSKSGSETERMQKASAQVPEPFRAYFYDSWGRALSNRGESEASRLTELAMSFPEKFRPYFFYGLATGSFVDFDSMRPEEALARILKWPEIYRRWFYFDFGRSFYYHFGKSFGPNWNRVSALAEIGPDEMRWICRGLGAAAATGWIFYEDPDDTEILAALPPQSRADYFWGIGWAIKENSPEDLHRAEDGLRRIAKQQFQEAERGLAAYAEFYSLPSTVMSKERPVS